MRRTGERPAWGRGALALVVAMVCSALPARADESVSISQEVDRTEVGLEDTFRLEISVRAPQGAEIRLPEYDGAEILSRSQSRSIQMMGGSGRTVVETTLQVTLILRPNRPGPLTLPPARATFAGKSHASNPITVTVKPGSLGGGSSAQRPNRIPTPFGGNPRDLFGGSPRDLIEELEREFGDLTIPRGDSDLFLSLVTDRQEAYVGEQITMSLWLFSRVDLSSVDGVSLPKLDGFWSEDVESPTQLAAQQKIVNGVPYRAFLLRRRALFATKPGNLTLGRAEADVSTGFLFAGHRVHRKSEPLTLQIKPLPPGAPAGMSNAHVGRWSLEASASQTELELGQPVTLQLTLSGVGNLRNVQLPAPSLSPGLKAFDPSRNDSIQTPDGVVSGRRTLEYLLMPQKTGEFVIPPVEFPYFDPKRERYAVARTAPLRFTVRAGAGSPGDPVASTPVRNVVGGGGIRPLRHRADFGDGDGRPWRSGAFIAAVAAPSALWLALLLVGLVRARVERSTPGEDRRRQAKVAHKRLEQAQRLAQGGEVEAFHAEVEKALIDFLSAQLGTPVTGLTREALMTRLAEAGVDEARRSRVRQVLEACELGRYAPGAATGAREELLASCARAMEGWKR